MAGTTALVLAFGLAAEPSSPPAASGVSGSPISFKWCGGRLSADLDYWEDRQGIFSVHGWSYLFFNSHSATLRVDGGDLYSTNLAPGTRPLPATSLWVDGPTATGKIVHTATALARITTTLRGLEEGGCCFLGVRTEIENLDSRPHRFEWRWFHDTAFAEYRACPPRPAPDPDVDGGEVCLPGETPGLNCRQAEFDALAAGAASCASAIAFYSADTGLVAPVYTIDDRLNPPLVAEILAYENSALEPAYRWSGFVDGQGFAGCEGDNALLLAFEVPAGGGTLAAGRSGALGFRIGEGCAAGCCTVEADAGPDAVICEGASARLGASPSARGGTPPYTWRWSPASALSDPAAPNPVATPAVSYAWRLLVTDAMGCAMEDEVSVSVVADVIPGGAGNSLLAARRGDGIQLEWSAIASAASYTVRGDTHKEFASPIDEASGLAGTSARLVAVAGPLRFLRLHGASCSGRLGP